VVKSPIRAYHLGHSDIVDFARQFTDYRMDRFQKQVSELKNGSTWKEEILATMSEELEIVRNSYKVFLDHCQSGKLELFEEGTWLPKICN